MTEENVFVFMLFALGMTFFGGIGFLAYSDLAQKHEFGIACIEAGKSVVEGSCVRIAP